MDGHSYEVRAVVTEWRNNRSEAIADVLISRHSIHEEAIDVTLGRSPDRIVVKRLNEIEKTLDELFPANPIELTVRYV